MGSRTCTQTPLSNWTDGNPKEKDLSQIPVGEPVSRCRELGWSHDPAQPQSEGREETPRDTGSDLHRDSRSVLVVGSTSGCPLVYWPFVHTTVRPQTGGVVDLLSLHFSRSFDSSVLQGCPNIDYFVLVPSDTLGTSLVFEDFSVSPPESIPFFLV